MERAESVAHCEDLQKLIAFFDSCSQSAADKVDVSTLVFHCAWNRAEVAAESHAQYCYRYVDLSSHFLIPLLDKNHLKLVKNRQWPVADFIGELHWLTDSTA